MAIALAIALGLGAGAAARAATPSIQMPVGELATESWDWVARLDGGEWLLAQAVLSNLGLGDRHAAVLGHLIAADGRIEVFRRSESEGGWRLGEAGRRLDLRSIAFTPFGPTPRFEVARDALGLDLAVRGGSAPAWTDRDGRCGFDLLDLAAPATARVRRGEGSAWRSASARVALSHRSMGALETGCLVRRVELFVLEDALGLYFAETTAPGGAASHLLIAQRDGRTLFAGDPQTAAVTWQAAADGFAPPATARFAAAGVSGVAHFDAPLASVDPTDRLPATVQWLVAMQTRPRLTWQRAPFEITVAGRTLRGEGIAKVTYSNPLQGGRVPARVAAHAEN